MESVSEAVPIDDAALNRSLKHEAVFLNRPVVWRWQNFIALQTNLKTWPSLRR